MLQRHLFGCFFCLFLSAQLMASHIIGGEIYYDDLGSGNYRITLKVYRDCLNGVVNFDGLLNDDNTIVDPTLSIFDSNGNYVTQIVLDLPLATLVPPSINNTCISSPNTVCIEEGVYTKTITLTPQAGGYYIVYQRCCRSAITLNLLNPNTFGATFFAHIPGPEVVLINSSPRFSQLPPLFVCNGLPIGFDHSALDPDGDVLVYSLCAPFQGLGNCCGAVPLGSANPPATSACASTCPPFNTPPYMQVPFISPYSGTYPLSSSPVININSATGFLNGTPNLNGQWATGVQVQEFRNNVLIGTHFRDYMLSVVPCIVQVASIIKPQTAFCVGSTITFTNQSIGSNTWHWDFGVGNLSTDTSNIANPSYAYADTGRYEVTLVVNPGQTCVDSSKQTIYVYPKLAPAFVAPAPQCIVNNSFNFNVGGQYTSYATFYWNFGATVNPQVSFAQSPSGINYTQAGTFLVKLVMKQAICTDSLTDSVTIFPKPVVDFDSTGFSLCNPAVVTFTNVIPDHYPTSYQWHFSDGGSSTLQNPKHTFSPAGSYSVSLLVITNSGCIDSSFFALPAFVAVNPLPASGFSFLPDSTSIFDPDIYFLDGSQNAVLWQYDFGDGASSTMVNPSHPYQTWGDFIVVQIVTNQFGCSDTATRIVKILPEFRYWVPNAFTPHNVDGMNDVFTPVTFGVEEYVFSVYNRWGQCVFETTESNKGWDGTYHGQNCKQDVYTYRIFFKNIMSKLYELHNGSVTLLK